MTQQEVIIELKYNQNQDTTTYQASTSSGGKTVKITVTRSDDIPSFYRYTHTLQNGGGQFILEKVLGDGSQKLEGIPPPESDKKAFSVSAYYWKHEKTNGSPPTNVLMVGITTTDTGNRTKYYKNSDGNKWVEKHDLSTNGELIEKTLDEQNCYSNDAVTFDLTKDAYRTGSSYCCDGHKNHSKVSVESVSVNHTHKGHNHVGSDNLTVKKYSILGTTLAAIKLAGEKKKNRKRIKFDNGPKFPITGPVDISALYSKDSKEPVLIYIDASKSDKKYQANTGWYQNNGSGGEWTKADELGDATPETINNCRNWSKLVKELEHSNSDLQDCSQEKLREQKLQTQRSEEVAPEPTQSSSPVLGPSTTSSGGADGAGSTSHSAAPGATTPTSSGYSLADTTSGTAETLVDPAPEVTEIQHLSDPFSLTVATQPYLEAPPAHQPRGNDSSWIEHTVFGCLASWSNEVLLHCG